MEGGPKSDAAKRGEAKHAGGPGLEFGRGKTFDGKHWQPAFDR